MRLLALVLLLCGTAFQPAPHPLKMCVCDAKYLPATRQMQCKFRFFWDDLEAALERQTGRDLTLNQPSGDNDRLLTQFVNQNFQLTVNQKALALRHVQSAVNDVGLTVEFVADDLPAATQYQIDLTNQILLDAYADQYNLVRFDFFGDGNLTSLRFERAERRLSRLVVR